MEFIIQYGMEFVVLSYPRIKAISKLSNVIRPGTRGYLSSIYDREGFTYNIQFYVLCIYKVGHSSKHTLKRLVIPVNMSLSDSHIVITKITSIKQPSYGDNIYKTMSLLSSIIDSNRCIKWSSLMTNSITSKYNLSPAINIPIVGRRNNSTYRGQYANDVFSSLCRNRRDAAIICDIIIKLYNNHPNVIKLINSNIELLSKYNDQLVETCIAVKSRATDIKYSNYNIAIPMLLREVVNNSGYTDYHKLTSFENKFNRR